MFNENEEQLINMGNSAEELLKTDVFTQTVNTMVDATFQAFCNSKPEETAARDKTYHHYRALVDIVSTLQQRVAIRDEIVAKATSDSDNNQEDA